jgi:hypothetical protein
VAGTFSRLKVCARFTAVRAVMSRPSVTHNNALGMSLPYLMLDENWSVVETITNED